MSEKLCVFCRHWQFDGGEPHYSELTPGRNATMGCAKGHYGRNFRLDSIWDSSGFRETIIRAQSCPDYEQVKP